MVTWFSFSVVGLFGLVVSILHIFSCVLFSSWLRRQLLVVSYASVVRFLVSSTLNVGVLNFCLRVSPSISPHLPGVDAVFFHPPLCTFFVFSRVFGLVTCTCSPSRLFFFLFRLISLIRFPSSFDFSHTAAQVILKAQIMFGRTVLNYEWPTASNTHTVTTLSSPPGLSIYHGDEVGDIPYYNSL